MNRKIFGGISPTLEMPILVFLWRWKVATTSAIYIRFRPVYNWSPHYSYKKMMFLKDRGLVEVKFVEERNYRVWTLTKKGFSAVFNELPPLAEEGYASECPGHDLISLAAHYGDWLPKGGADDVVFYSEQDLRRRLPETLVSWLPPVKVHRPDGYWNFPNTRPNSLVALEVEINRKKHSDYVGYGNFYNRYTAIEAVIWIVQSQNLARKICNAAQEKVGAYRDIHQFVLYSDLIVNGWGATIFMGSGSRSKMREFLNKLRGNQLGSNKGPIGVHGPNFNILDSRHRRFNSTAYATVANAPEW